MIEVTSTREAKNNTIAWGYQYRSPGLLTGYTKIIKMTETLMVRANQEYFGWTVHIRYYGFSAKSYRFKVQSNRMTFVGYFDDKYKAYLKIRQMIRDNGVGTKKQWNFFKRCRK